jgi:hypothetical protein
VVLAMLTSVAATVAIAPTASAADPATNSEPHLIKACGTGVLTFSDACLAGAFSDINAARAKEGVGELKLPSNFRELTTAQQLFVLANIDRVDRGLPPISGLSSALNAIAQPAADAGDDPNTNGFPQAGSNWASTKSPLWSAFLWMYDDGPGGPNIACDLPDDPGCWGHRHIILGTYNTPALMGAAVGAKGNTELFVGGDVAHSGDVLTWAAELPYFKNPITAGTLGITAPGQTTWKHHSVKGKRVKLTWSVPAGAPAGYLVTAGKKSWTVTKPKLKTHLKPGVYHFRVQAQNAAGLGPKSPKLTIRVKRP